jgi:hypothetical protein
MGCESFVTHAGLTCLRLRTAGSRSLQSRSSRKHLIKVNSTNQAHIRQCDSWTLSHLSHLASAVFGLGTHFALPMAQFLHARGRRCDVDTVTFLSFMIMIYLLELCLLSYVFELRN